MSCPACKADNATVSTNRGGVVFLKCDNCGVSFADAWQNGDGVVATHPDYFHGVRKRYDEELATARQVLPRRLAYYADQLARPVNRLLEIGCATAVLGEAFAELGVEYVGVEFDQEVGVEAQARGKADVLIGNFLNLDIAGPFDVVFFSQVLEHIQEPVAFLKKAIEMAPDGLVHFDVPNHASLTATMRKLRHSRDYGFLQPPHHMVAYDPDSMQRLLDRSGLDPILLAALPNDDPVLGQMISRGTLLNTIAYRIAGTIGLGSLLSVVARPAYAEKVMTRVM